MRTRLRRTLRALIPVLLLGSACASAPISRPQGFSVPSPIEWLELDASRAASGATVYSLASEEQAVAKVGFTQPAWDALSRWFARILRDRCAMRAELQVANGQAEDPDPVCQPETK